MFRILYGELTISIVIMKFLLEYLFYLDLGWVFKIDIFFEKNQTKNTYKNH